MFTMKKKIMAVVAALAIMTVGTTAFAAGSPAANETKVDADPTQAAAVETVAEPTATPAEMAKATTAETSVAGLEIDSVAVAKETVSDATVAATDAISNLSDLAETLGDDTLKAAAKDSTKKVSATVAAVVNLEVTEGKIPAGGVTVTIKNPAIKAGKTYVLLHYTGTAWEKLAATDVKDGALNVKVTSLSPVAIVEVAVADADTTAANDATTTPSTDAADKTTADSSASAGTSPKTGETTPVALFALLACVAGALACSKKSEN
jgi:hypothetical protein